MKALLTGVFLLIASSSALAQTHPCDAPDVTSARVAAGVPLKVQVCQPVSEAITGLRVYNGQTGSDATGLTQLTATPNASGKVQYEASIGSFAAGLYTLQFAAVNADGITPAGQEGPKSSPFALTVVIPNPPPTAPAVKRVGS